MWGGLEVVLARAGRGLVGLVEEARLGLHRRLVEHDRTGAAGPLCAFCGSLGGPLGRGGPPPPARARRRRRGAADDLGFAEGAHPPGGIDRLAAAAARLLELLHAVRAAQEARIDLVTAAVAGAVLKHLEPSLRGADLQLTLVGVLEVLGRP